MFLVYIYPCYRIWYTLLLGTYVQNLFNKFQVFLVFTEIETLVSNS